MILKNSYVRATLIVLVLTILAGLAQANINGPLSLFALSGTFLGSFLILILACMALISLIKERRQAKLDPKYVMAPKPISQLSPSDRYKKGFVWSLIVAAPGLFFMLSAALTTRNGGGEAYIVFIPLFFVSSIAIFAALLYGIAYLFKRGK